MSVDERCRVKCCERHLMCFISVCLNCPGTLESLSVNQIRCNETRSSHLKTCVFLLSLRLTEEKGLSSLLRHRGYMIVLRFTSGIAHAGLFHYISATARTEVTLELIQTSGVPENKIIQRYAAILDRDTYCNYGS